jgi:SAM-dependent methyltransferase
MNNIEELSPVDKKSTTIEIDEFSSNLIIEQYKKIGLNVERFFIGINNVTLRKCSLTNYRYYSPFNCMGDDQFYQELQNLSADYYPKNKWEHKKALKYINKNDKVLEIGCATGYFLECCIQKKAIATGIELNKKAAAEAISKGLDVKMKLIEDFAKNHQNEFDVICSFQVLEHISDVNSFIKNSLQCLKPGGLFIFGVPNNNPFIFKHDKFHTLNLPPHHAGLWNKESIENTAKFFHLNTEYIGVSPLYEAKEWYNTQMIYYKKKNPFISTLMRLIPRPIYKLFIKSLSNYIEGKTILAVLK